MEKELKRRRTVLFTKETSSKAKSMDKVSTSGKTREPSTMVSGLTIALMAMENIVGRMVVFILGNGR